MTKNPKELTNDWKARKLEPGWYWIKNKARGIVPDNLIANDWMMSGFCNVIEVLAPCNYDHFADLRKKAEKYDRIKVNGNYPDKISKLKSRIKKLLEEKDHFIELTEKIKTLSSENERLLNLQAVKNKEIKELESDSLTKKEGEEIVAELTNEYNELRGLLKECKQHLYFQKKINNEIITLLVRINVALGESEEK